MIWIDTPSELMVAALKVDDSPAPQFFVIDFHSRQLTNMGVFPNIHHPHYPREPASGVHYFLIPELHQWLVDQKIDYKIDVDVESVETFRCLIGFSTPSEATLFKLTWG